jgi:hypothetical protein
VRRGLIRPALVLVFVISMMFVHGLMLLVFKEYCPGYFGFARPIFNPANPSGTSGAASSALLLGLDDVPASPAASLLASEVAALGANVIIITNTSA